jgi:hypothetical protein
MGFRFRKSIKIFPGLKINISKKGVSSVSVGGHGATLNVGKNGVKTTVGIPGTGISYSENISTSHNDHEAIAEPVSTPVEHSVESASTGVEHFKTWLIIGLVIVIVVMVFN